MGPLKHFLYVYIVCASISDCMLNRSSVYNLHYILQFITMPKYAVAKGRKVGVYDTWNECKAQTEGFNGAKFKKFETLQEATEFLKEHSGSSKKQKKESNSFSSVENKYANNALPVPNISPSTPVLNEFSHRISVLETKLSHFIEVVDSKFDAIKKRLTALEERKSIDEQLIRLENEDQSNSTNYRKRKAETEESNDIESNKEGDEEDTLPEQKNTKLPKCKLLDEIDGGFGVTRSVVNGKGFLVNPYGAVVVYTDGACSNNGKQGARAGIGVWFNNGHPLNVSAPVKGRATNNNAEIQAASTAILQASKAGIRHLHIFTDSQFLINSITSWIFKWKKNDWKTIAGKPVINRVELEELDTYINEYMDSVIWTYVKGHSGDMGNTSADKLARQGAANYVLDSEMDSFEEAFMDF